VKSYLILGDHNAICDVCGFQYKGSQLKKRWDGALVCHKDFEQRHPQDFVRAVPERQSVRDARPLPELVFITGNGPTADDL